MKCRLKTIRTCSLFIFVTGAQLSVGCIFAPPPVNDDNPTLFQTADTPEILMENFVLSYETRNTDEYLHCLHDDFEFILLEVDWADYNGDGIIDQSWGRDKEEEFTTGMFNSPEAQVIELMLNGTSNTEYYGDPTGATRQLVRSFELKVYFVEDGVQVGHRASGEAIFLCRPDENGEYRIWQWTDLSEV
ncbi:MAG TPA: hypothetical protein PLM22_06850 [Candidatus Sabulitectum sp.]|nr:hypothetical protein [Candidatus Sabulitectum sp.]